MVLSFPNTFQSRGLYFSFLLVSLILLAGFLIQGRLGTSDLDELYAKSTPHKQNENISHPAFVPAISLIKEGIRGEILGNPGCISIEFTYIVTNESDTGETLENIAINDPDLGGNLDLGTGPDSGDANNNDILDPGESWVYLFDYTITPEDINAGHFGENAATVTADVINQGLQVSDLSHPTDILDNAPTIVDLTQCQIPNVGLTKQAIPLDLNNDNCFETIRYRFRVRNIGNVDLHNVILTDDLLGGTLPGPQPEADDGDDGILSVDEIWTYQVLYAVGLQETGSISNQATVIAESILQGIAVSDQSHPDNFNDNEETSSPYDEVCNTGFARIQLKKESNPLDLNSDNCFDAIEYTFTIQNGGDVDLHGILLFDELLGGIIENPEGDENSNEILEATEEWTYTRQYFVSPQDVDVGQVTNQALVTVQPEGFEFLLFDNSDDDSFDGNDETVEDVTGFCPLLNIGLKKESFLLDLNNDNCPETIRYLFTVENTGLVDLEEVSIRDQLLLGEQSLTQPIPGQDDNNDETLSVGEDWEFEIFYHIIQSDIDFGEILNRATVTALEKDTSNAVLDHSHPENMTEDGDTQTITSGACPAGPSIGLVKTGNLIDTNNDGCPDTIHYTFEVQNTGTTNLYQIVITDEQLFEDQTFEEPIPGQDDDGILSPQETWTYEAFHPINQTDIDQGFVDNRARVTALEQGTDIEISDDSHPEIMAEDGDTRTITSEACPAGPSIGLIKMGQLMDQNQDCPNTIHYTFVVQNTGTVDLEQVSLMDEKLFGNQPIEGPIPGDDINEVGILSIGEVWRYEAFYPISQPDIDAGEVENRATVSALQRGTQNPIISDESHPSDITLDGDTVTPTVGTCDFGPAISLVKVGQLLDLDDDNCPDTIQYTFVVTNTGSRDLDRISILDNALVGEQTIDEPLPAVDENNDGVLSAGGEYWVYVLLYSITQEDIDAGWVENHATVTAFEFGTDNSVSDLSDFESRMENRPTIILLDNDCFITVEPPMPPDVDFKIHNGLTPNEDGFNDYFRIDGIESYPNNHLQIFNRWGVLVYEAEPYGMDGNLFDGSSFGRATIFSEKELPSGTYFYILSFPEENPGQESYTGYLYINRK